MNGTPTAKKSVEEIFFLTDLLGAHVYFNARKVGKLEDMIALDKGEAAEITYLEVARPFGGTTLFVPFQKVRSLSPREIVVDSDDQEGYVRELQTEEIPLRDYLIDKKVLDTEDREVEVVYDIRLVRTNGTLYVSDVDISRYGLLRRVGFRHLADYLYRRATEANKKLIPWFYVQSLSPQLSSLQGAVKLSILKEELADLHPADLADMVEKLDSNQRVTLLEGLDTEHASDILEEIDPAVQRDIVFSLRKERVAQLIGEMTSGQAADIVAVLPAREKREILLLLDPAKVTKIDEILQKHETNILSFTSGKIIKCPPDMTVLRARRRFREMARSMDVVAYYYIVNEEDKLLGVINIKELFMAEDDVLLGALMVENVITLNPESTMKQAADMFLRYGFRALPVTDKNDVILGAVPYRDVMNLEHRILD